MDETKEAREVAQKIVSKWEGCVNSYLTVNELLALTDAITTTLVERDVEIATWKREFEIQFRLCQAVENELFDTRESRLAQLNTSIDLVKARDDRDAEIARLRGAATCQHESATYNPEHANYYCDDCKKGMGQAFYDAAKGCEEFDSNNLALRKELIYVTKERDALRTRAEQAEAKLEARKGEVVGMMQEAVKRDWVRCPVCGEPDMRREQDADDNALIYCVNHACESNVISNTSLRAQRDKVEQRASEAATMLDSMRDEFDRIIALATYGDCALEIRGLCERAKTAIEQHVPVIVQRDQAEQRVRELELSVEKTRRHLDAELAIHKDKAMILASCARCRELEALLNVHTQMSASAEVSKRLNMEEVNELVRLRERVRELEAACRLARDAIMGYKMTNNLAPDSVLGRALDASRAALKGETL